MPSYDIRVSGVLPSNTHNLLTYYKDPIFLRLPDDLRGIQSACLCFTPPDGISQLLWIIDHIKVSPLVVVGRPHNGWKPHILPSEPCLRAKRRVLVLKDLPKGELI